MKKFNGYKVFNLAEGYSLNGCKVFGENSKTKPKPVPDYILKQVRKEIKKKVKT